MNRGRGRQTIFHGDVYFNAFLQTIEEAHDRFGLQIHCYCLMSNHYHLLVKTPEANLGRAMRHINGQYTQRYNRLRNTDGSLFRGRYKAILVENDSYQLQLSRYIHRNPIDAYLVDQLDEYQWSSYTDYVSQKVSPAWLYKDEVYQQLTVKSHLREKYRTFVEMGVDEEIAKFYAKGNQKPYLGSEGFRKWVYRQRLIDEKEITHGVARFFRPDIIQVAESVAQKFSVDIDAIKFSKRGRVEDNIPRWLVMYLAQSLCGLKLREIANYLGLKRTGSIPTTISKFRSRMEGDQKLVKIVESIKRQYDT